MMIKNKKIGLLPLILIAIALGVLCGLFFPEWAVRIFVTFNGVFSQLLGFFVPLIILGFVAPAIFGLKGQAGKLLLLTVLLAYVSTVCAGTLSYLTSSTVLPEIINPSDISSFEADETDIAPYFALKIPPMIDVIGAIVLAFALGLASASIKGHTLRDFLVDFKDVIELVISRLIVPLLPLYIFGIFLNMTASGTVYTVMSVFLKVIVLVIAMHLCWLVILFCIGGIVRKENPFKLMKTMLPSYVTALGTQSSVATIPVNLKQVQEIGVNEEVADFVVPLCANIHLSGSILQITSFSVALMILQQMPYNFGLYIGFILMLAMVVVAAPGVPGGAIMASLGVLSSILGFSPEDQALMISLYIAVDSFGTATNVTGDGVIAIIVDAFRNKKSS